MSLPKPKTSLSMKGATMKTFIAFAAVLMSTSVIAQPVSSDEPKPTEQVTYSDLNLATAAGQSALERRIRGAAGRVCDFGGTQELEAFSASYRCYRTALSDGLHQMNEVVVASKSSGNVLAASALVISGH
jgi:UrcA family protein